MSQLGYTWYPQDWWTSETFKRLKRFPIVRYTIRELFDLMYKEGHPIEMNRDYLIDDFNIELTDDEYKKLLEFITITEDGKWWINSIRKRLTKSEAARENGKSGGRPKGSKKDKNNEEEKTQKPSEKTKEENPKNPSLEIESEIEIKDNINVCEISETQFIDIWKRARTFYDKKPTNIDKLLSTEKILFKQLLNDGYKKQDFEFAVAGLFFQKTVPAVRIRPEWLLRPENFFKMLDCWKNKSKIFDNSDKQISGSKFVKGDV